MGILCMGVEREMNGNGMGTGGPFMGSFFDAYHVYTMYVYTCTCKMYMHLHSTRYTVNLQEYIHKMAVITV